MRPELLEAADRLYEAATAGVPCPPVRDLIEPGDTDSAYAVQQRNIDRTIDERGWRIRGRKIGLTSPAVQAQLGVDQPDFGALFAELGHVDGDDIPTTSLLQPKVEAEVALVLGADLTTRATTVDDVVAATDHVLAAIEIVDSRIADWDITFVDTVADNASSGRYILGDREVPLDGLDLSVVTMSLRLNGTERSTGSGAACMGNPLKAAAWLASRLADLGTPLRAGDLVLTGALGPMTPVAAGDEVEVVLDGLGVVRARFIEGTR